MGGRLLFLDRHKSLATEDLRRLVPQNGRNSLMAMDLRLWCRRPAYLRLVGGEEAQRWNSRGHFFAAAAEAMRRILVNRARRKRAEKHGGRFQRQDLDGI